MKIKLENFSATIDFENVEVQSVNDNINSKICSVNIVINGKYGTTLNGFEYVSNWTDNEVKEWVSNEMVKLQTA